MNKNISNKKVLKVLSRVAEDLQRKNLIKSKKKIILTTSGGQDSNCLLIIFFLLRTQLLINFDLLFCQHFWQRSSFFTMLHVAKCSFCCSTNIMFFLPLRQLLSEKTARDWRHKVIQRTTLFYGYDTATQAHTKSDRIETILFNLIRGTGLTGISTLQFQCFQSLFSCNKFYPVQFILSAFSTNLQLGKINNLVSFNNNVSRSTKVPEALSCFSKLTFHQQIGISGNYAYFPIPPTCTKTLFLQDSLPLTRTFTRNQRENIEAMAYYDGINLKDIYVSLSVYTSPLLHTFLYTYLELDRFEFLTIIDNKKILKLVNVTKTRNDKVYFFRVFFYQKLPINYFYFKKIFFKDTNSGITKCFTKVKKNPEVKMYKTYYNQLKQLTDLQ